QRRFPVRPAGPRPPPGRSPTLADAPSPLWSSIRGYGLRERRRGHCGFSTVMTDEAPGAALLDPARGEHRERRFVDDHPELAATLEDVIDATVGAERSRRLPAFAVIRG